MFYSLKCGGPCYCKGVVRTRGHHVWVAWHVARHTALFTAWHALATALSLVRIYIGLTQPCVVKCAIYVEMIKVPIKEQMYVGSILLVRVNMGVCNLVEDLLVTNCLSISVINWHQNEESLAYLHCSSMMNSPLDENERLECYVV